MRVVAPSEDAALREHSAVHLLPADAIMLHDRLVWDAEGGAGLVAPVRGIEAYRGLLESFACAAESEEALCVQVREDEDEDVEGEVRDAAHFVGHHDYFLIR
jgi:hypothetical protein